MAPRRTRGARIESRTPPQYAMRTERGAGRAMERMETAPTYLLIINHGRERGYETRELERDDFIVHTSRLLKRPRKVFFGEVPRNPTGKIEKPKLRKMYSGMEEAFKI